MTSYAAASDIEAVASSWFTTPFAGGTNPTLTQVNNKINQVEGIINGVLSAEGYETVPATGANDVLMLRDYTAKKVVADLWRYRYADRGDSPYRAWEKEFEDFLARLRRGEQYLIDQQPQSEDEPFFMIIRQPQREDYFTERNDTTDWDE